MAEYLVELGADHEDALSYALELETAHAAANDPPTPPPAREPYVSEMTRAGLSPRYVELTTEGNKLVEQWRPLEPPLQQAMLNTLTSPALRSYVARHLAAGG